MSRQFSILIINTGVEAWFSQTGHIIICINMVCMYVFLMFIVSSVTVIAFNPQVVGQLLIVDCNSDISNVPSTKNQIVGQSLILCCRVNTVRPIADVDMVTFIWQ